MLRQRAPTFAAVGGVVNLAAGRAHIHSGGRPVVRCHGLAQYQQVRVALRQAARQQAPGFAAVAAARYAELALGRAAVFGPCDGHREERFLFGCRDRHPESEARRHAAGNVGPLLAVETGFVEAAMVLLIQALGVAWVRQQMMHALPHLGEFLRLEIGAHALVEGLPGGAAIARAERAGRGDRHYHPSLAKALNGMQAHAARAGVPAAARRVRRERWHLRPRLPPVRAAEQRAWVAARIHHARFIGRARLDAPDARQRRIGQALDLQAFFRELPVLAAIGAGVDVRPEPRTVYCGVEAFRRALVLRHVIDFQTAEERAFHGPGFAVPGTEYKGALAGPGPDGDGRRFRHRKS